MNSFIQKFTAERVLWMIVLWQFISVGLVATGVWPQTVACINFGLLAAYMATHKPFYGLLLFIASLPFYIVLPNPVFDSLSMWRPLAGFLLLVTFLHTIISQKLYLLKISSVVRKLSIPEPEAIKTVFSRIETRFMWWDKYIVLFGLIALISTLVARFPVESIKQILFLFNVYILYIVAIFTVTSKEQVISLIKYIVASTGMIVLIGYLQLVTTLFSSQYYFWQYWATMVSRVYYGLELANVLVYSNSWFSYTGNEPTLRMFGILPDSHSFGMIAVIFMCALIPLTHYYAKSGTSGWWKNYRTLIKTKNSYVWSAIRFAGLAVIFSGTRGLWVGMIPALFMSLILYGRNIVRPTMKKAMIAFSLVILFFLLSPFINQGLSLVRSGISNGDFLNRAASIYDLNETSNVGRLIIWKDSLVYGVTHPFGVGYGNFIVSLVHEIPPDATFEQAGDLKNMRYNLPQKFVTAHSLFLNILVELGVAGLLAFGLLLFEIFFRIWRFLFSHRTEDNIYTTYVALFGLMLIWFLAYGIFDVTIFNDKVLTFFFVSLALCGLIMRRYDSFKDEEWIGGKQNG